MIPGNSAAIIWGTNVSLNFDQDGHLITVTFGLHSVITADIKSPTGVKVFLQCCFPLGKLHIYFSIFRFFGTYIYVHRKELFLHKLFKARQTDQ